MQHSIPGQTRGLLIRRFRETARENGFEAPMVGAALAAKYFAAAYSFSSDRSLPPLGAHSFKH